ncbi:signal transduction histidine kinase [Sphingomonas kaistensis]|uniref:histidine kinase n=1 Tax=Sphingomonas kaistensis TaxID=298708 RepID=A0A7X5Y760_9SPHN|nr:HAMP domain-containing sensor histidine kinase [Sphingomonas kaistensis]NJC05807.1 signal transduction histidine kinase [Sphingomonas kaistensis]
MEHVVPAKGVPAAGAAGRRKRGTGSLTRRMIVIAAIWISILLAVGGFALNRLLTESLVRNFDESLELVLRSMIGTSELGTTGELKFSRPPADQRFIESYSGSYFQITPLPDATGRTPDVADFPSRSLWDRRLAVDPKVSRLELFKYDSYQFSGEPLRIVERDVIIPGSEIKWRFQVAQSRENLDSQLKELRTTLTWSFAVLGLGLVMLAALQTFYGLWPLRRVRHEVVAIRSGAKTRISDDFPDEIQPLTQEINQLLAHNEEQAEEARRHAGNLAHALKTPLTVITNAATARDPELHDTVCREATTMRRQVDHHLARARAIGRRASAQARAPVWESLQAVQRAVTRIHEGATVDIAGDKGCQVRVERQDLDEMLGNLVENAAKYGSGRVFVTVEKSAPFVDILIEDDGPGIPEEQRTELFTRGKRLDTTGKPGTGLGLAIVRDVAEIYGGRIALEESEDLGGLLARLSLPLG